MYKNPHEVLEKWMKCVNEGDLDNLLDLYDPEAVLIPTFSNRLLNTPDKLKDYFERLAAREELSIALHEKTLIVQEIENETMFSLAGIYNWRFAVDGEILNFEARFSYVLDLARPSPVLHHHSSQIPRVI